MTVIERSRNSNPGQAGIQILDSWPEDVSSIDFSKRPFIGELTVDMEAEGIRVPQGGTVLVVPLKERGERVRVVTSEGLERGRRLFFQMAKQLAESLVSLGQDEARIAPFGSVTQGTWVEGTPKGGFFVDEMEEEGARVLLGKGSDVDIAVFVADRLSEPIKEIGRGRRESPDSLKALAEQGADVWIWGRGSYGVEKYRLVTPER